MLLPFLLQNLSSSNPKPYAIFIPNTDSDDVRPKKFKNPRKEIEAEIKKAFQSILGENPTVIEVKQTFKEVTQGISLENIELQLEAIKAKITEIVEDEFMLVMML